jgi:hypothetical protein
MIKSDLYRREYAGVGLWDSDVNEQYVSVEAYRVLELTVVATYDRTTEQAHMDEIVGSRVVGHSY